LRKYIIKLLSIIITIILVALLLFQIGLGVIVTTIRNIDIIYIVIGFFLYIIIHFFRALRFKLLLNNRINHYNLFKIVCLHNMINNILPVRTGEFSYVYLTKKLHNIPATDGIANLMIVRIFDSISVSVLFLISAIHFKDSFHVIGRTIWIILIFLVIIIFTLIAIVFFGEAVNNAIIRIITLLGLKRFRMIKDLQIKIIEIIKNFEMIKRKGIVIQMGIISIIIWMLIYLIDYVLMKGMGINLNIFEVIFGSTFSVLTTILPLQGICGFGTLETGWAIGFTLIGVSKEMAITSGFSVHIIAIFYTIILGSFGMLLLRKKEN